MGGTTWSAGRRSRTRRWVKALVACVLATGLAIPGALAEEHASGTYQDPDYAEHDLDNYTRARGRTVEEGTSAEYHRAFASACLDSSGRAVLNQANDAVKGRLYAGVGQASCWWSVGDAPDYFDVNPHRVHFLSRTGAKLQGHVWGTAGDGPRPGVVITTGSIQASDQMYWWAARALAAAGYVVLTFDVQGQGQSETFSHEPGDIFPGTDGVPSQQAANFYDGTVDALRFFLSTPERPYVPAGWTREDVAAAQAASDSEWLDWVNPGAGALDRANLGIIGHSLGASAVSNVQMCSDEAELWRELELCAGQSFPIRAVVGWDALNSNVTPVVPGMSQISDGYFLFPTLSPSGPGDDPAASLGAFRNWTENSDRDVFTYVVRAGTHIEWSQVPYTAATTYGVHMNLFYTLNWLNRWVSPDRAVREAAYDALLAGPLVDPSDPTRAAANYMSVRRYSAFKLTAPDTRPARAGGRGGPAPRVTWTSDIRHDYAGLSAIGDWKGANEDTAGSVLFDAG
jgi:hypothetical protein